MKGNNSDCSVSQIPQPKTVDSKAVLQAIEENLVSSIRRVSGELDILQSSVIHHLRVISAYGCKERTKTLLEKTKNLKARRNFNNFIEKHICRKFK